MSQLVADFLLERLATGGWQGCARDGINNGIDGTLDRQQDRIELVQFRPEAMADAMGVIK